MYIGFLGLFALFIAINLKRSSKVIEFELTHNCLMTRHPLVFMPGPFSFFYFLKYWNNIPYYLREHGYDVIELKANPFIILNRKKHIMKAVKKLTEQHQKLHLIFDPSQINVANYICSQNLNSIKGIHIFCDKKPNLQLNNSISLHTINSSNELLTPNYHDYSKMIHDMFVQSPQFVPAQLLGAQSNKKMLTVEPIYLKKIINIAENDWH